MDIVAAYAVVQQIFGQFFRHPFGQGSDQRAFLFLDALLNLFHQIVYLVQARTYFDDGVQQAGRADDLFYDDTFALYQLVICRCSTDVDDLFGHFLKLFKLERPVVHGCRQTESVFHEVLFPCPVSSVHGPYLRDAYMTFIDHNQEIFGEEIQQAIRAGTWLPAVKIARIVFDTGAVSQFA